MRSLTGRRRRRRRIDENSKQKKKSVLWLERLPLKPLCWIFFVAACVSLLYLFEHGRAVLEYVLLAIFGLSFMLVNALLLFFYAIPFVFLQDLYRVIVEKGLVHLFSIQSAKEDSRARAVWSLLLYWSGYPEHQAQYREKWANTVRPITKESAIEMLRAQNMSEVESRRLVSFLVDKSSIFTTAADAFRSSDYEEDQKREIQSDATEAFVPLPHCIRMVYRMFESCSVDTKTVLLATVQTMASTSLHKG